jgi:hypothetical protein
MFVSGPRLYWDGFEKKIFFLRLKGLLAPVALSVFWATEDHLPFGEHFAAWEQPKLFAEEIRARFRAMPVDEMEVRPVGITSKSRKAGTLALL